jgi:DNA invertase Pin-like site-specific DNA recombinase
MSLAIYTTDPLCKNWRMRWIGYVRVSSEEQALSGLGLAAQRATIEREAERAGAELVAVIEDAGASGKDLDRAGLHDALTRIAAGDAEVFVVAKVDRLSRSLLDVMSVLEWLESARAAFKALDSPIDTSTAVGKMFLQTMGMFAEFERQMIRDRTRAALAVRKAEGKAISRPAVPDATSAQIKAWYDEGWGLTAIARQLNDDGVPTARGGTEWRASNVQSVLGLRDPAARKRPALPPVPARRRRARASR